MIRNNFHFSNVNPVKLDKANKMLRSQNFNLYAQLTLDTVFGVIRSQRTNELLYACFLRADGSFSCQTQNLHSCGGLRGSICKHIIVLLGYMTRYPAVIPLLQNWVNLSIQTRPTKNDELTSFIFKKFSDATDVLIPNFNPNDLTIDFEAIEGIELFDNPLYSFVLDVNQQIHIPAPFHHHHQQPRIPRQKSTTFRRAQTYNSQPTITIIESHVSFEGGTLDSSSTVDLELNYVICIGDRTREGVNHISDWHKCSNCNNWLCPDCYTSFMTDNSVCPSSFLGIKSHSFTE